MKINNNNINFGSRHLYGAILKKRVKADKTKDVPVFLSELNCSDIERMDKNLKNWASTDYGKIIINKFLRESNANISNRHQKYLIVETKKGEIKALAAAEISNDSLYLNMLQSQRQKLGNKSLSGAGSCILYMLSKIAHSWGRKFVSLYSIPEAAPFYDKVGFQKLKQSNMYFLPKYTFGKFEKTMESKYSIKPVTKNYIFLI